jgi:hypothetical protein
MKNTKDSYGARLPLAITLIVAAFASAFFISTYSNRGYDYWVIAQPVTPGHVIALADLTTDHLNLGGEHGLLLATSRSSCWLSYDKADAGW